MHPRRMSDWQKHRPALRSKLKNADSIIDAIRPNIIIVAMLKTTIVDVSG
jgi:hypothetical protein